jgi:ABC-type amino acid transport substrate-binding protein
MKHLGKLLQVMLLSAWAVLVCTGTGSADTLADIKSRGTLRVGMADSTPSQSKDPNSNEWEGFNVDMAKNLAEQLGVKLEIVDASWSTLIPGLLAGQYDIAMCDMFATPKRAQTVAFTTPYMNLGFSWVVRADFPGEDAAALDNPAIRIANLSGSAMGDIIRKLAPRAQVKDVASDNVFSPHLEVASGRAAATLSDHYNNTQFLKRNPNVKARILGGDKQFQQTPMAYAVRPDDQPFLNMLNSWIIYNQTTGLSEELRHKWYGF